MSDGAAKFTPEERRILRRLANAAHDAEVGRALVELDAEFVKWRAGETANADLLVAIHGFHQHESRDLWSLYQSGDELVLAVRGLARGLVTWDGVPAALKEKLASAVDGAVTSERS